MKISKKIRLCYFLIVCLASLFGALAANFGGISIGVAVIMIPLLVLFAAIYSGTALCPRCGKSVFGSASDARDMNPYYQIVWHGRCGSCDEKI